MMLYKYLFYFCAYFEKKYDRLGGDPYISSYIIVGLTIAVNIFVILDVACILFAQNTVVGEMMINSMLIFGIATIILSYLYFRRNNRRDEIFEEINQSPKREKIKYGIYCLFYLLLSYGLWFMSNDIMCVLKKGYGLTYAENIVHALNLAYWK